MVDFPLLPNHRQFCLWRVHKLVDGERNATPQQSYDCGHVPMGSGWLTISASLTSAGLPSDEWSDFLPDGSSLNGGGTIIRRRDGLADFSGMFTITSPTNAIIFSGIIELMDRVGTHHPPFGMEPYNPPNHIEGWLVGSDGPTPPSRFSLRALFVASGLLPALELSQAGESPLKNGSLDGVIARLI